MDFTCTCILTGAVISIIINGYLFFQNSQLKQQIICLVPGYPPTCRQTDGFRLDWAIEMVKNYREKHLECIKGNFFNELSPQEQNDFQTYVNTESTDFSDAQCACYDLETLKSFIYTIESNVSNKLNAGSSMPKLGIRIYYAEYPVTNDRIGCFTDGGWNPQSKKYHGLHTLLMIPTYWDKNKGVNGAFVDFDPVKDNPDGIGGFTSHYLNSLSMSGDEVNDGSQRIDPSITITALDRVHLQPPPQDMSQSALFAQYIRAVQGDSFALTP